MHAVSLDGIVRNAEAAMVDAKVTPLFSTDLKDFPGKEGLMIAVEYPPESTDPIRRHNAHGSQIAATLRDC